MSHINIGRGSDGKAKLTTRLGKVQQVLLMTEV